MQGLGIRLLLPHSEDPETVQPPGNQGRHPWPTRASALAKRREDSTVGCGAETVRLDICIT